MPYSIIQSELLKRVRDFQRHDDGSYSAAITFDPAFTGFDGHFPGNPVVPAVCQLSAVEVLAHLALGRDDLKLATISLMKFRAPLVPNDTATFIFRILQEENTITIKADVSTAKQKNASKFKLILQ
jgi:3-hydroxyacyl-[acyl-carrier-protein] dehydratase